MVIILYKISITILQITFHTFNFSYKQKKSDNKQKDNKTSQKKPHIVSTIYNLPVPCPPHIAHVIKFIIKLK